MAINDWVNWWSNDISSQFCFELDVVPITHNATTSKKPLNWVES
jgi:hypothetical protein